ncbi:MAG: putative transport system permease protein [Frankiaceae bacterium]|nr:putative transport system permease protein [Frankiaceae bacterium]
MLTISWLRGLVRRRPLQLAAAGLTVAMAVGFLSALGGFVGLNRSHLTDRAAGSVAVDWQVQLVTGADHAAVERTVSHLPGIRGRADVQFAAVSSLSSVTTGGRRTTGRAYVVGLSASYATQFAGTFRPLLGTQSGPVLLQQTAANLAAGPGDPIQVHTSHGVATVKVSGVVDMPQEDSFFQKVGAPPGVGPPAPPDNVVIMPTADFVRTFRTTPTIQQIHVRFDRGSLPANPATAADLLTFRRNHFESSVAGSALVGDNLGAALSAAREDALYGEMLFLLLGIPIFAVAIAVTILVVGMRKESRAREVGLLRLRGASRRIIVATAGAEAALVVAVGVTLAWPVTLGATSWAFNRTVMSWLWFVVAAVTVASVVLVAHLLPTARRSRAAADRPGGPRGASALGVGLPLPLRLGLDVALLVAAGGVFWLVARGGYQVVVVPEGVPVTSVNWAALAAPALAWPGLALLAWRAVDLALRRPRSTPRADGRELVSAVVRRRRRHVARAATALAVAVGVAGSTAVFTATYREQSRLDVALTVGADVAVALPGSTPDPARVTALAARAPHVQAASVQEHRFTYVGTDLQDLYGIDPQTIRPATALQDSFVPGSTIAAALNALRATPSGVLLSAETLHDYQLHPGDDIRLRLQTGTALTYRPVTFRVLGEVTEWPTAPKDSFVVANASYLRQVTGRAGDPTALLASSAPESTAAYLRRHVGAAARVEDVVHARASIATASGLAAVDLGGLSRLELGFGVVLAVAALGLALLVGVLERRRALVILAALGASARQRRRFVGAEARVVLAGGLLGGGVIGAAMAAMLVKVMTGIFDPPPDRAIVPWLYLALLAVLVSATAGSVVALVGRWAGQGHIRELRDL